MDYTGPGSALAFVVLKLQNLTEGLLVIEFKVQSNFL